MRKSIRRSMGLLGCMICAIASAGAPASAPKVGASVKDFELTRLDGTKTRFSSLGKKVVLVNLWASWCAPCLKEMPGIAELWKAYRGQGFEVLAINEDENSAAGIEKTRAKVQFPFELYVDQDEKLAKSLGASSYPFTLVLNAKGKVLAIETREHDWNGAKSRKQIEAWLK